VSLGTFEFLTNPHTKEFYFLEINPRLQVEHTLTETILDIDLVRAQLLIAQGVPLSGANLPKPLPQAEDTPHRFACQLRLTAEDASKGWALGIGKISNIQLPCGNGVRVDSALAPGQVIGSSFDSLLAKIIASGPTWEIVVQKARRALADTSISGVKTNLDILRGIVASKEFAAGDCDTTWLERNQDHLLDLGNKSEPSPAVDLPQPPASDSNSSSSSGGAPLFKKGDSWTLDLKPANGNESNPHHLAITRILRNDFPTSLTAEIEFTPPAGEPHGYELMLSATTASAGAVTSSHRRGDASNPRHVIIPFPGKLVEVMVDEGDVVKTDDVICVVQQMKMEIEIRAKRGGKVVWVTNVEDGEEVNEGILAAIIDPVEGAKL
jgi:pyruvate carboxylase